jgi:hypothetical protein
MTPTALREEIAAVFGEVTAACRMLATGRHVDLSGLELRVDDICKAMEKMPRPDGRELLPLLQDLNDAFAQLAIAMRALNTDESTSTPK